MAVPLDDRPVPIFGHNFIVPQVRRETETNTRELEKKEEPTVAFFPVTISGGAAGLHAYTEDAFDANGARYTKSGGRRGVVNGVGGSTVTWNPALMPDGSTLSSFPAKVYLKETVTVADGTRHEIFAPASGQTRLAEASLSSTSVTIPAATETEVWSGSLSVGGNLIVLHTMIQATSSGTHTILGRFTIPTGTADVYGSFDSSFFLNSKTWDNLEINTYTLQWTVVAHTTGTYRFAIISSVGTIAVTTRAVRFDNIDASAFM